MVWFKKFVEKMKKRTVCTSQKHRGNGLLMIEVHLSDHLSEGLDRFAIVRFLNTHGIYSLTYLLSEFTGEYQ